MLTVFIVISVNQMPDMPSREKFHSGLAIHLVWGFWWRLLEVWLAGTGPSVGTQLYNFKLFSNIPLDRLIISVELEKELTRLMVPSSLAAPLGPSSQRWPPELSYLTCTL